MNNLPNKEQEQKHHDELIDKGYYETEGFGVTRGLSDSFLEREERIENGEYDDEIGILEDEYYE